MRKRPGGNERVNQTLFDNTGNALEAFGTILSSCLIVNRTDFMGVFKVWRKTPLLYAILSS